MTADDRHRCRWHTNGPSGRCPNPEAFPRVEEVPQLCTIHLAALDPWITARASLHASDAAGWIDWARRRAEETQDIRRMLGERPALRGIP